MRQLSVSLKISSFLHSFSTAADKEWIIESDDELSNAIKKKQASISSKQGEKQSQEIEEEVIEFRSKANPNKRQRG